MSSGPIIQMSYTGSGTAPSLGGLACPIFEKGEGFAQPLLEWNLRSPRQRFPCSAGKNHRSALLARPAWSVFRLGVYTGGRTELLEKLIDTRLYRSSDVEGVACRTLQASQVRSDDIADVNI